MNVESRYRGATSFEDSFLHVYDRVLYTLQENKIDEESLCKYRWNEYKYLGIRVSQKHRRMKLRIRIGVKESDREWENEFEDVVEKRKKI